MNYKWNNEKLDEVIKPKNIKRISEYVSFNTKMIFKCLDPKCGHEWETTPPNILKGRGCKQCHIGGKLNNTIIDQRLQDKNIIRLEEFSGTDKKIKFKCLIDGFEWYAQPSRISCRKCNGREPINNDIIDSYLVDKPFKRSKDYVKGGSNFLVKCDSDGYEWNTNFALIRRGQGCAKCAGNSPLTDEIIDQRLIGRNIIRLEGSQGSSKKIKFKCLIDDHEWNTKPSIILSGKGCPNCKHKNEARIRKYLKEKYGESQGNPLTITANKRKYIVDFVVNGTFIEYNGGQHYKPVEHWGGQQQFQKQQKRDQELRDYCKANNIRLIEIPYWLSEEDQYKLLEGL
jgi:hypothetical protein